MYGLLKLDRLLLKLVEFIFKLVDKFAKLHFEHLWVGLEIHVIAVIMIHVTSCSESYCIGIQASSHSGGSQVHFGS